MTKDEEILYLRDCLIEAYERVCFLHKCLIGVEGYIYKYPHLTKDFLAKWAKTVKGIEETSELVTLCNHKSLEEGQTENCQECIDTSNYIKGLQQLTTIIDK